MCVLSMCECVCVCRAVVRGRVMSVSVLSLLVDPVMVTAIEVSLLAHTHTLPHKDLTSSCARATALSASRARPTGWVTSRVFPESPLYPPLAKPIHTPHGEHVHQTRSNVEQCLHDISYRHLDNRFIIL